MSLLSMFAILFIVLVDSQISFSRSVFIEPKQCSENDTCVAIDQCPMFGSQFNNTEWSSWPGSVKQEFESRVCLRTGVGGTGPYKVCCPRSIDLLDLEGCGPFSHNRISGGQDAQLFQYPWMALLQVKSGSFECGGTLINERYVLTAAHCFVYKIVSVRLGEFDLSSEEDCNKRKTLCTPPPQDIGVERVIPHKAYSAREKVNDIGLIRLAQKASLNDNVKPICLPVRPELRHNPTTFIVAGWGTTEKHAHSNILQHANQSVVPIDACKQQWLKLYPFTKLTKHLICAKGANFSEHCTGDSGAPLKAHNDDGRFVQYGVVAFGPITCGSPTLPNVYTRVRNYIYWILAHLEE